MNVDGTPYRTIWLDSSDRLMVIDQRLLPHQFKVLELRSLAELCEAISNMTVRGAGLIGATAAYGLYLAGREALASEPSLTGPALVERLNKAAARLLATRPTAGNLARALERQLALTRLKPTLSSAELLVALRRTAEAFADEDAEFCRRIGEHGLKLILRLAAAKAPGEKFNILTHCNAGWLAFVDYGSALAPVYAAWEAGVELHVWVDETRPRNQGASLSAWELARHGVPHSLVADNTGGHLMQHGLVDLVLVGADRVTRRGDAANKIGTYLKALAAWDNGVPFYVALPSTTFDPELANGLNEIPIEERSAEELRYIWGRSEGGQLERVLICPEASPGRNWAFDVTPARLISGLICERGLCPASEEGILSLFPEWGRTGQAKAESPAATPEPQEGVVRYQAFHRPGPLPLSQNLLKILPPLEAARTYLHDLKLIGVDSQGVGFGNISARLSCAGPQAFLISGTGSGGPRVLGADGYSLVTGADIELNQVFSSGPARPSSEAMTHAAIYLARPEADFVIHVHHQALFRALKEAGWPQTPLEAGYGSPALALAVGQMAARLPESGGAFISAGHENGLFSFGPDLPTTLRHLIDLFQPQQRPPYFRL